MNSLKIPDRISDRVDVTLRLSPLGVRHAGYLHVDERGDTSAVYLCANDMRRMAEWLLDAADVLDGMPLEQIEE